MRTRIAERVHHWLAALSRVLVVVVALAATLVSPDVAHASTSASAATTASTSSRGTGSPWALAALPTTSGQWTAVTYVAGLFVALGRSAVVATSRTGTAWSLHPAPGGAWSSVAFGAGQFVALSSSSSGAREMRSTNGVEWTPVTGPVGQWTGVAFGAGRFVAVGSDGRIATSTDGLSWRTVWVHSKFTFTSIAYGNGRFIAVDDQQGDDLISLNGLDWSFYQITSAHQRWSGVAFGDGNFVAFNNSRRDVVASSVLGYTWTAHVHAPTQILNTAAFGCDTFVTLGHATQSPGRFFTSPTGATWTSRVLTVDALARWTAIAFGASRFVAVSSDGRIASMRASADCARATPTAPRDVSGNIPSSGHVWTYMHPPSSTGDAPIDGYLVTVSDGVSASTCWARVYYQPNCVIAGLRDRRIYYVTTQAHNRYGYSVPSDPEWVIPVASWNFSALSPTGAVPATSPVLVEVTGVRANAEGIYPQSTVTIHIGGRLFYCQPSWFGECVVRVADARPGRTAIYATYVGYGQSHRTPTSYVTVTP